MENHSPQHTLLGLPSELRLEIFDWVFRSTIVSADRCPWPSIYAERTLSTPPAIPHRLNLVCRAFNEEIGTTWHSRVTYHFPSTVALIDVLSQWNTKRVQSLRHVIVKGTPVPLDLSGREWYDPLNVMDGLAFFPGLQLDTLTVESPWLESLERQLSVNRTNAPRPQPEGERFIQEAEILSSRKAIYFDLLHLLTSGGWKELRYLSEPFEMRLELLRKLEQAVAEIKMGRSEDDFVYDLSRTRPKLTHEHMHHPDGTQTVEFRPIDEEELPHAGKSGKEVAVWARRGVNANYVLVAREPPEQPDTAGTFVTQPGQGWKIPMYGKRFDWPGLRTTLIDDGVDNCWKRARQMGYIPSQCLL